MKQFVFLSAFILPIALFSKNDSLRVPDSLRNWHRGGMVALNFTQSTFTNWASGGENSVSGQTLFGLYVNYKNDSTSWDNGIDFAYGILQQGKSGLVKKTDDKIDFTSKYGRYAFCKVWYYSALVGFKTQFAPGYTYHGDTTKTLISEIMAPAYSILAIGLDYKPNKSFSVFVSPLTGRITYVMNQTLADAGALGVEKAIYDAAGTKIKDGQNIRYEFGGYVRFQYKAEIMPNVNLKARCELFTNYLKSPQNVDVNADILVTMKVNKYISASLNIQGIYDHDVNIAYDKNNDGVNDGSGPRFQFRQVLGIGFATKF